MGNEAGGTPRHDAGLLRRSLDGMPAGLITTDADGRVCQYNTCALEIVPFLATGVVLREKLEELTHVEKVDRMLIQGELVAFPGEPGGPELHWLSHAPNTRGEQVTSVWLVNWAERDFELRADFTMAASHELRVPLTTLRGFAEILNSDTSNMTPVQAEAAGVIGETVRQLTVLVDDVFDLSRNSFGELRLNVEPVDLEALLLSVADQALPRVREQNQTIICENDQHPPLVEADPFRATQMITNLVNNASVHNPAGTTIRLVAGTEGDWVTVKVEDDGNGLPFENPEEALRSFRRGETATEGDRAGSGTGLALTRRLIELHRGRITVESGQGSGTCFTLWFPMSGSDPL